MSQRRFDMQANEVGLLTDHPPACITFAIASAESRLDAPNGSAVRAGPATEVAPGVGEAEFRGAEGAAEPERRGRVRHDQRRKSGMSRPSPNS